MASLSFLIPTYNRADKLLRLLNNIEAELVGSNLRDSIKVLVSDNASTDDTQSIISNFEPTKFKTEYFRQENNLGFDGNVRFLYDVANTDYIWFFSDDDILLPGAIATVMKGLLDTDPDVLLFSFEQPLGSVNRTFNLPGQFEVVTDAKKIIKFVSYYPKISIYVLRKINLSEAQRKELEPFYENGFYWIDLCYSVLSSANEPRLCIISQPLASCDNDFFNIRFGPDVFLRFYTIFNHPFISIYFPAMADESRAKSYYDAIQLMFAVKLGSLRSDDPSHFEREIASFSIRIHPLLKNPRALMQLLALKLKIVPLYRICKRLSGRTAKSQM
jgi:glycosyltransferase involved in cell wall biosynthesis